MFNLIKSHKVMFTYENNFFRDTVIKKAVFKDAQAVIFNSRDYDDLFSHRGKMKIVFLITFFSRAHELLPKFLFDFKYVFNFLMVKVYNLANKGYE